MKDTTWKQAIRPINHQFTLYYPILACDSALTLLGCRANSRHYNPLRCPFGQHGQGGPKTTMLTLLVCGQNTRLCDPLRLPFPMLVLELGAGGHLIEDVQQTQTADLLDLPNARLKLPLQAVVDPDGHLLNDGDRVIHPGTDHEGEVEPVLVRSV